MSAWKIDYEHDSDAIVALKKQIANQDIRCSALQDQLLKSRESLEETKGVLNETMYKLRLEADRAMHLESDLAERKDSLESERLSRQNAETALQTALAKIKADESASKHLQQTLESVSQNATGSNTALINLQREKSALERRVLELQTNMQHVVNTTTPARHGRPRASSLSDMKIASLQHELAELRLTSARSQTDLQRANEKLGRLEANLCRAENEKTSLERRMGRELECMKEMLAEKDEDLERIKSQYGDQSLAREREEELMRRVEEEEAKVVAMERLLAGTRDMKAMEDALQKAERKLAAEMKKARGFEERNSELARDRKATLEALDESQRHVERLTSAIADRDSRIASLDAQERDLRSQLAAAQRSPLRAFASETMPTSAVFDDGLMHMSVDSFPHHSTPAPQPSNASTTTSSSQSSPSRDTEGLSADSVEKLLSAIERLRGERDGLRRDLEFLQLESKFTVEALEDKLAAAASTATSADAQLIDNLKREIHDIRGQLSVEHALRARDLPSTCSQSNRFGSMACAAFVMVNHLQHRVDENDLELQENHTKITRLRGQLDLSASDGEAQRQAVLAMEDTTQELRNKLEACLDDLHAAEHQRDELLPQLAQLRSHRDELLEANLHIRTEREDIQSTLEQMEEQLTELTKMFENVDSERASLAVQVVNLQNDVTCAQEELADAEQRYSVLQAQQLSSMSSGQVSRALREQIEELEGRVMRRTEQIGIHQHDIHRLETNLRLQEDRVNEMTVELETAMSEKASMVDDCAEAREARDLALQKVEDLEEDLESLENKLQTVEEERAVEATTLVHLWSSSVSEARVTRLGLLAAVREANAATTDLMQRSQSTSAQHDYAIALLHERTADLCAASEEVKLGHDQLREVTVALALSQSNLTTASQCLEAEREAKIRLESQLCTIQEQLNAHLVRTTELQQQLEDARSHQLRESASMTIAHSAVTTELETQIRHLKQTNAELETSQSQVRDKLAKCEEQLQRITDQHTEAAGAGEEVEQQLELLRTSHSEESRRLQERIAQVEQDLQVAQQALATADSEHAASISELSNLQTGLEERLEQSLAQQETDKTLAATLTSLHSQQEERIRDLEDRLTRSTEELERVLRVKQDLETLHQEVQDNISSSKIDCEKRLAETIAARDALQVTLKELQSRHEREVAELQAGRREIIEEAQNLRVRLQAEVAGREQEKAAFDVERREILERNQAGQALESQLRQELSTLEAQVKDYDTRLLTLQDEKASLEEQNTDLESELQRGLSMHRFLESQIKQSEREIAALKADLVRVHEDQDRAEAASKRAEMELALQCADQEQVLASLRRQLEAYKSGPRLEETVRDLQEQITEMDELMRSKTQEIEENDDRFIQLYKERKKLTTKVESLTRKVQSLQSKLAATKDSVATIQPDQMMASTSRQTPPITRPVLASIASRSPVPSLPPIPAAVDGPSTPRSRYRVASGPSILPRPKTPDSRLIPPVFRAKTPEPKQSYAVYSGPMPTTSFIGKKRAAPDDVEESAPAQGFTSEGVIDPERNRDSESTPRMRKSFRTGFTPVRNTSARPVITLSPVRAAVPVISDVTNSPRSAALAEPKALKRSGWLGKLRGGSQVPPARPLGMSRGTVFERAPQEHS